MMRKLSCNLSQFSLGNPISCRMMSTTQRKSKFIAVTAVERIEKLSYTLTPEQQEYVAKIKKQITGGPMSKPSPYRDVPTPDEVKGLGNYMPRVVKNAQNIIDYALSHLPKKTGPKRSRHKARLVLKQKVIAARMADLKKERLAAHARKQLKQKRIRQEVKDMWAQVRAFREVQAAKAALKANKQ